MSLSNIAYAACSSCGKRNEIKIYKSINVSSDPDLKEKVRDGSLFVWECPECGGLNLAKYETLYHDPEKKLMIWLLPGGDLPESEMAAIMNHTSAMGDYTLRRVGDVTSLMEKVLIFDEGLDDRVIEMCKYVTRLELAEKGADPDTPLHFYRSDGEKFLTLTFPENGRMNACNVGFNVYEDCRAILERNAEALVTEGFARIDSTWIDSFIR